MSDTTVIDVTKMKVVDLRKELKSRGLSYAGDKAELVARLQAALTQDEHGDINLDSDEIDSDLDYEDEKSQNDILDDTGADTLNEELALAGQSPEKSTNGQAKPQKTLKRKLTSDTNKEKSNEKQENKDTGAKKIVLNRNISMCTNTNTKAQETVEDAPKADWSGNNSNKVKITADLDPKTRLEMRAKRFGLPVKVSDAERKEARKQRFGQNVTSDTSISTNAPPGTLASNMEKLKKRAERFGQSVSAIMTDIENKEKLEKRKAKFATVK